MARAAWTTFPSHCTGSSCSHGSVSSGRSPAPLVLARLYSECSDQGIWSPKSLRAMPKSENPVVAHYFPLEGPGKSPAQRQTDVTFRLALIARLLGIPLNIV